MACSHLTDPNSVQTHELVEREAARPDMPNPTLGFEGDDDNVWRHNQGQ